jgi:hypothetical protein
MNRAILLAAALVVLSAPLAAQCGPISNATFTPYGRACGLGGSPTALTGAFSPATCAVTLSWTVPGICCNIFVRSHLLAIGVDRVDLPVPALGQGCALYTLPLMVIETQPFQTALTLPVPPEALGVTFRAQAANLWFDTFCLCLVFQLSQGLEVVFT